MITVICIHCIYFIKNTSQVLDAIAPPYTQEFVQLVLPMVENEEITGTMRAEGENDPVSEFIGNKIIVNIDIFVIFISLLILQ